MTTLCKLGDQPRRRVKVGPTNTNEFIMLQNTALKRAAKDAKPTQGHNQNPDYLAKHSRVTVYKCG